MMVTHMHISFNSTKVYHTNQHQLVIEYRRGNGRKTKQVFLNFWSNQSTTVGLFVNGGDCSERGV